MKSVFQKFVSVILLFFVVSFVFAQNVEIPQDSRFNQNFINKVKSIWIDINNLETKTEISRYELARILNLVECWDCLNPGWRMLERYTPEFWNLFTKLPWKDFDDIQFDWWLWNWKKYYYCVAYVWDMNYMRWYPAKTSPVCAWKFCGAKSVTKAEFIQVVINILSKYIYSKYSVDWAQVYKWASNLKQWTYAYKTLNSKDLKIINEAQKKCPKWVSCNLESVDQFKTYLKYCMFNLKACDFQPFGRIKQSYRPVSELNIMKKEWLIPLDLHPEKNIHKPVDWQYVLDVIWNLSKKINCKFILDYDCDKVPNNKDNCPNAYNPHQYDFDHDWKWNVCDEDIDNWWMTHPIWIVDDQNNIVIDKRSPNLEKNFFDPSDDKTWNNQKNVGSGIFVLTPITLDIKTYNLWNKNFNIQADIDWDWNYIIWNFGDWVIETWQDLIQHQYNQTWTYLIVAEAVNQNQKAIAKATLYIWNEDKTQNNKKINLNVEQKIKNIWQNMKFVIFQTWLNKTNIQKIILNFDDWDIQTLYQDSQKESEILNKIFDNKFTIEHIYKKEWYFYPKLSIIWKDCVNLTSQATIYIQWNQTKCLEAKADWNFKKYFHCDMDKDWIPDICDWDIDWDGYPNQMWLIMFENPDCKIVYDNKVLYPSLSSWNDLLPQDKNNVSDKINSELDVCSLDPDPFSPNKKLDNPELSPVNPTISWNNLNLWPDLWNFLPKQNYNKNDSDGDWIVDSQDLCPNVFSSFSKDWCPKLLEQDKCFEKQTIANFVDDWLLTPTECNQCPCQFADFAGDLQPQDTIRAVLMDTWWNFTYTWSYEYKLY